MCAPLLRDAQGGCSGRRGGAAGWGDVISMMALSGPPKGFLECAHE
jgi:hypothetical protein